MSSPARGHSRRVARGIEIVRRLPAETASGPEAREALAPLEHVYHPATFETIRLLATELVAN
jgi:hypothetical protein